MGYLVCSRYDTVWHVMNVAVDDRLLREGIATALMEHLFAEADGPGEQYTLEVRTSEPRPRSGSTSGSASAPPAAGAATTTTTARTP